MKDGFEMSCNDYFQIGATLVANEFLDKFMPSANGDYVKVYLYLLRNSTEAVDIESIAEALELTEGDVRRAVRYWEKCGIISLNGGAKSADSSSSKRSDCAARTKRAEISADAQEDSAPEGEASAAGTVAKGADPDGEIRSRYKRTEGKATLNRLSEDAEFKQLLFMVQKYRSKILTESEEQVLAYLYDGLHLPFDVLDYLVQYCVETDHNSMRYIEKTGLDWAGIGIRTVSEAKRRTKEFDRIREEKSSKTAVKKYKNGMQGETKDLDSWLNEVVQRNIQ